MSIPFPDYVVINAWKRSGGKCECHGYSGCIHVNPHQKELKWEDRGKETQFGWEAHHIDPDGPATLDNCQILCQPCHKNTPSFGG